MGADVCRFSTGGATHANQAVALAVGRPGDEVVVSRTLHRSMLIGLVLAGLVPVWVRPDVDPATGLPLGVAPATVARALAEHPRARAVFVGDPSYVGTVGDVAGLADAAHAHDVPLVVDGAWAAHFGFHPDLPRHALQLGADVLVTSAHKTLPAWSQAALVLARTQRVDPVRLDAGVEATATTSPAGAVLASTDAARALLARDGEQLLGAAMAAARRARDRLADVSGLVLVDGDPLVLTLVLPGTGADGLAVERDLLAAGLPVEAAERDLVKAVVTLADDDRSLGAFTDVVTASVQRHRGVPRPVVGAAVYGVVPVPVLPPREAFFADREAVPLADAVGRVCAELVAPYPPGIPVLAPGRRSPRPPWLRWPPPRTPASGSPTPPTPPWRPCRWCVGERAAGALGSHRRGGRGHLRLRRAGARRPRPLAARGGRRRPGGGGVPLAVPAAGRALQLRPGRQPRPAQPADADPRPGRARGRPAGGHGVPPARLRPRPRAHPGAAAETGGAGQRGHGGQLRRPAGAAAGTSRLVAVLRVQPLPRPVAAALCWGDLVMMRRQLQVLAGLAAG
ncbi:aminotransferase class V-fold PLP-dependent enzyme [Klenkia terrae]|uniref:aminotransferase class V-fold PLP-dependent enzyme n=1 Tax=Klenkia terrae TaxID=1052259 RepID=UPI00361C8607